MKLCDITMAYNSRSGGIKTYIDEKRRFVRENTDYEHLLIIPGARDRVRRSGRTTTVTVRGPLLPGQDVYRFFLSPAKIRDVLLQEAPDIVELGSYYTEPWAAFSYRRRRSAAGQRCVLGAYFHTDVARAYVEAPLRAAAQAWLEDVSEALLTGAEKIADVAASGAEKYMRYVFAHCDVTMAASAAQAARLAEHGVRDVAVVPMGVDLRLFTPRRRSESLRARLGAGPDTLVAIYAGRLCKEKRTLTALEAFARLPAGRDAQFWIMGDGPQRPEVEAAAAHDPRIKLMPYENDRQRFAEWLASADVYLSAGPFETFALSVIEAQACGLPVVGVDAGALRERVPPGLGFLGPVDDAAFMADHIARAAQQRSEIGMRARAHVVAQFSWQSAFERWLECYGLERPPRLSQAALAAAARARAAPARP